MIKGGIFKIIRRNALIFLISALLILVSGCAQSTPSSPPSPPTTPSTPALPQQKESKEETYVRALFEAKSPVSSFSEEDIDYLGIDCSGSDEEIAGCIKKWQEENMTYAPTGTACQDFSDPIRWNYFLPGIFTSRGIIYEQLDNGKIYGICFDFAVIYSSIAEYYGLESRVMSSISKPSDTDPSIGLTTGMSPEQYGRLKLKLEKLGLDYPYDAVRLVAEETPAHYWVEVKLDGQWVIQDATEKATGSDTKSGFYDNNDYEVTDWLRLDKSALLEDYARRLARGERLPEPTSSEGPTGSMTGDYEGMTDDLGQLNRAANIDDLMKGLALAPYFDDAETACDFVGVGDYVTETDLSEAMENKEAYESCSGKKLYLVCYFICDGDNLEGTEWIERYELYSGEEMDLECYNRCLGD